MINKLKKIALTTLSLAAFLLFPTITSAASGQIVVTASQTSVTVGNTTNVTIYCSSGSPIGTCEYTISYDSSMLTLTNGQQLSVMDVAENNSTTYLGARTYTFKIRQAGSTTVGVSAGGMLDWEVNSMSVTQGSVTITGTSASSSGGSSGGSSSSGSSSYSTNDNLASLTISSGVLTPEFNKDTTEYTAEVSESLEKITIEATTEDNKATIAGIGELPLTPGDNKFEIVVTSEKGTTKKYTITINLKDENPIAVKVNNTNYTVNKSPNALPEIEGFTKATVKINNIDIPVLKNATTGEVLIGLKDEKTTKVLLFTYDEKEKTYQRYLPITFKGINLIYLNQDKPFKDYKQYTIKIGEEEVIVYKVNEKSNFNYFYAKNPTTNEEGFYVYDSKEETIQRYNNEELTHLESNIKKAKIIILAAASLIALLIIIIIIILIKHRHKKGGFYKEPTKFDIQDETKKTPGISNKDIDQTIKPNNKGKENIIITKPVDIKQIKLEENLKVKDKKAQRKKEKELNEEKRKEELKSLIKDPEPSKKDKKNNKNIDKMLDEL